jgi:hypothetical protein
LRRAFGTARLRRRGHRLDALDDIIEVPQPIGDSTPSSPGRHGPEEIVAKIDAEAQAPKLRGPYKKRAA